MDSPLLNFFKNGETFTPVQKYDHPVFVICLSPGFKSIFFNWYSLKPDLFKNESVLDEFLKQSYKIGEEWEIVERNIGINEEFFGNVSVSLMPTPHDGLCIKVEFLYKLLDNDMIFIGIKISNEALKNIGKIDMFVAAKNTWQGVTYHNWPYTKIPLKIRYIKF